MDYKVFNAVLSMDAYNRGYNAGIVFGNNPGANNYSLDTAGTQIGVATIFRNKGDTSAQDIGFYALAYDIGGAGKIISYRGTDDFDSAADLFTSKDVANGWLLGGGDYNASQAWMAVEFYNEVADSAHPLLASISTTGHSLGGGLASYVSALYHKDAEVFDSMGYLTAANLAYVRATTSTFDPDEQALKDRLLADVYNVTQESDVWNINNSGVTAYHAQGEVLHADFTRQAPSTSYYLYDGGALSAVQKHSMSTLVIRLFAETEIGSATDWKVAMPHFWSALYDGDVALSIGMDDSRVSGQLQTDAQAGVTEKYADILRTIIAYSAIDEGPDAARPFGDTGIRALYSDMNDLGAAITAATQAGVVKSVAWDFKGEIVQAATHFAGQLALNKVLKDTKPEALDGVLSFANNSADDPVILNLSSMHWDDVLGVTTHKLDDLRAAIIPSILTAKGVGSEVNEVTASVWGDVTYNIFDRLVFANYQNGSTVIPEPTPDITHGTLFIGGASNDLVYGSSSNELFVGSTGFDTFFASAGNDILIGGAGTYRDTADYSGQAQSISVEINSDPNFQFTVRKDLLTADSLNDIELIIGTPHAYDALNIDWTLMNGPSVQPNGDWLFTFKSDSENGVFEPYLFRDFEIINLTENDDVADRGYLNTSWTIDGKGGFDTAVYGQIVYGEFTDGASSADSVNIYGGIGRDTLQNFEAINATYNTSTGHGARIIVDETVGSLYDLPVFHLNTSDLTYNYYIRLPAGTQYVTNTGFTELDYSSVSGPLTFDVRLNHNDTNPSDFHVATVSGAGISHEYVSIPVIYGTNYGDTYNAQWYVQNTTSHTSVFYTGSGNDTFNLPDTDEHLYALHTIHYSGGNDEYDVGVGTKVILAPTIFMEDVTLGSLSTHSDNFGYDATFNIAGHGSLTLHYRDHPDFAPGVELAAGGTISFVNPVVNNEWTGFEAVFAGQSATTVMNGQWGIDTWTGRLGESEIYGARGGDDLLNGLDGDDRLFGDSGNDTIFGGTGQDELVGGYGDDKIAGEAGDDDIDGGEGTDEAVFSGVFANYGLSESNGIFTVVDTVGDEGTDTLNGIERLRFADGVYENGAFNPFAIITGTNDSEALDGTSGDDIISGLDGADVIHGLAGNDQIDGGGWNDEIYGGDDNDTIFGDWGHDFIEGGPGNDDMDGGVGYDIVSYRSAPSGITIDLRLSTPQDTGGAGIDTIVNFRAVRGSDYGDVITGDDTQNDLLGFDGDDTITGLRGNDTIHGGAGYDTAVFSGYYAQYTLTDFGDYITIEDRFGTDGTDVLYGIEALQFSDGTFAPFDPLPAGSPIFGYTTNDTINGDNNDNLIYGLWGIDTIHGLGGSDTIYGGEQGDLIFGDEGNDFLYGFHGSDIMDGGPGDDLIDGQSGFNTASYQSATSGVTVDLSIIGPQDTIGAGVDTLVQMKGLIGSDYADILYGNVLLNHIDGGAGDDWIAPGKADDIITGGAGADTIYLHADDVRWGFNTITDFNPGEGDALDIADVLFGYDALTNAITDFVTVTDNGVDSTVIVDQDGSGTQYAAKTIAVLQNITGLSDVEGLETAGTLITV